MWGFLTELVKERMAQSLSTHHDRAGRRRLMSARLLHKDRLKNFERRAWTYKQMYYGLHLNSQVTDQGIDITYEFSKKQIKLTNKEHRSIEKIEREWLKRN